MRAYLGIKTTPHYRRDAFVMGLQNLGYTLTEKHREADVVVLWNRIGEGNQAALHAEERGTPVLVAENAYLGNDFCGERWYAMSRTHHNGAGAWPNHGGARWDCLDVPLAPWRNSGAEIVVLPQRGIGPPGVAMPLDWEARLVDRLKRYGLRMRVRRHPGQNESKPLLDDLANAAAVVTWGSGAALKAIAAGIPVLYDFGRWIGASAAAPIGDELRRDDAARLAMFRRLAWAQWSLDEIKSGRAFSELLQCTCS